MNNINVKEAMNIKISEPSETFLRFGKFSADDAYARLKIVREFKDDLGIKLNKHVRFMPQEVRDTYEELYLVMKKIENLEASYVASGE